MPGATIGTTFNPMPEIVWDGHIIITKVGSEYRLKLEGTRGDATVDVTIRQHLSEIVKSLALK